MLKKIATGVLLALAIAGAAIAIKNKVSSPVPVAGNTAAIAGVDEAALPADGVVVTYFTTDIRCANCRTIEALSRESVSTRFPEDFKSGRVVFRVINTDRPEHKHFLDDYKLVSKTVIVSRRKAGMERDWVNLQDVWLKLSDPAGFVDYVGDAVKRYLDTPAA